ncbi:MAG: IMP dehydrogenase [bacterium]
MSYPQALTFDDILLLPGYTDFQRDDIDLSTRLTRDISLEIPFISSPMDTVTESGMAIALGHLGGGGVIHRNLTVDQQAAEVKAVKKAGVLAAAAVGSSPGYEPRLEALLAAGVEAIVLDSAHGHTQFTIDTIKKIKKDHPKLQVIAGSIATYEAAVALLEAGADALRVGMGPGSICSTRVISGMGVPQVTALQETIRAAKEHGDVPVIADGGLKLSGDMAKALALGASSLMMGSFFAAVDESPGELVMLEKDQVPSRFQSIIDPDTIQYAFKQYRGMGSIAAMEKGAAIKSESEFHGKTYKNDAVLVAEGVEGLIPCKGSLKSQIDQAIGGIRSGMYYVGAKDLPTLVANARFVQITAASLTESHPHDILMTNPGKNYS